MRPTAPMAQPHIHHCLIENYPGSDYSSVSCVPHIYGVADPWLRRKKSRLGQRNRQRRPWHQLVAVQQRILKSSACFYLGRPYDLAAKQAKPGWLLYDSKDLVTHAVCVGMTGSGKTGLCIGLLEEAAIDGIPALIIDPEGRSCQSDADFPQLRGEDFAPWVNEDDARKKGSRRTDYATQQAEMWKKGLGDWGQSGERIQKLRDAADVRDLHAWQQCRHSRLHSQVLCGAVAGDSGRCRDAARADQHDGDESAGSRRRRGRPDQEPRAHSACPRFSAIHGRQDRISIWPH